MMKKWDDVSLLCEPEPRIVPPKPKKRYPALCKPVLAIALVCLLVVTVTLPMLHFRRELPDGTDYIETGRAIYRYAGRGQELPEVSRKHGPHPKEIISRVLSEREKERAFEQVLMKVEEFREDLEEYLEDSSDEDDEQTSLQETVGEDPADPDAVAFLLPLRGRDGALGIRYGRRMKQILEQFIEEQKANKNSNETSISTVLVRDSQGSADVARKLTSHFYEIHGTTRYFGYLTNDEAMEVAHWARSKAPGTRYVTPTATTTYLESAKNIARVQPAAKLLASAVADLLVSMRAPRPVAVVRASLHTDAFLALLRSVGIRPAQIYHYYENTNITRMLERLGEKLSTSQFPVLLLGDTESFSVVEQADNLFPATWILPFPTQIGERVKTRQSDLLTFMYRAFDDQPGSFLKEEPMLNPVESIVWASQALLTGKRRTWQGAFVIAASVPSDAFKKDVNVLGITAGWLPLMQYNVAKGSLSKRVYQHLVITPEIVKPLASGSDCRLILTFLEELTGEKRVEQIQLDNAPSMVIVPAERGGQVHVDCPQQHADIRCTAPKGQWEPVKCQGTLQGQHQFMSSCGKDISLSIPTSKGCVINRSLNCSFPSSLGCLLADLCSSVTHAKPFTDCTGMHIEG